MYLLEILLSILLFFCSDYEEEKMMIELYLHYHNLDVVLLPRSINKQKLNEVFSSNYFYLLGRLRQNLLEEKGEGDREGVHDSIIPFSIEETFPLIMGKW